MKIKYIHIQKAEHCINEPYSIIRKKVDGFEPHVVHKAEASLIGVGGEINGE